MGNGNCSIKFYLNKQAKETDKGFPIYCRIVVDRRKAEFATDQYCQPKHWSKEFGMPTRGARTKEYLIHVESELYKVKRELEYQGKHISARIIRDLYRNTAISMKKGSRSLIYLPFWSTSIQIPSFIM